jgi:uncharacterized protein DUF4331
MKKAIIGTIAGVSIAAAGGVTTLFASSHREAPAIAEDQFADNTDVYTFISPTDPDRLVIVANYVPLLLGSSGPNFYKFSDEVRYDIHVDNDGDAKDDLIYRYTFDNQIKNGNTFLYNTGPVDSITSANLNVTQTYRLDRIDLKTNTRTNILKNAPVAPWNVGKRSFPNYEAVALQAIASGANNIKSFAGPRDEPFFVDLHVFDLLGVGGAPTTDGVNVMSLVLEVPITDVASGGVRPAAGDKSPKSVVGIHATAARSQIRILRKSRDEDNFGGFTQVSRLGWPLVNEVVIPLKDKDKYNRSKPEDDVSNFGAYILDPEVPKLLNAVLGAGCAPTPSGGRLDIVGLLSPNGTTPADLLRIDITAGQTNAQSHFPNGRALADDVTDTELTVLCNNGGAVGDGVNANDKAFTTTMPYLASPASGNP